jgi:hypothetical protein
MPDRQCKGSTGPMWWGILLALAFTAALVVDYNRTQEPARDSPSARTGAAR